MRIEVKGKKAKLYLNDAKQPALVVNDLKLDEGAAGGVGLWVDNGTGVLLSQFRERNYTFGRKVILRV